MNNKWHKHQSYPTPCVRDMKTKVRLLCTMSCWNHPSRPKKKLSCFWKSAMWKSFYHLPIHLSQMCMRIYFLFQKTHTHTHKTFTSKSIRTNASFFPSKKIKDRAFCFSTKKVLVQQFFKCKIYFKNSNKLIIFFFFVATQVKIFFVAYFSGNKSIIFVLNDAGLVSLMETISYIQGYN